MGFGICLTKEIEAAHFLTSYKGQVEPVHGHTWKIEIEIHGDLNEEDYVLDFVDLEKEFIKLNSEFDHNCFNNHPHFKKKSPTTENIARYYFTRMNEFLVSYIKKNKIKNEVELKQVRVWEGPRNFAFYGP